MREQVRACPDPVSEAALEQTGFCQVPGRLGAETHEARGERMSVATPPRHALRALRDSLVPRLTSNGKHDVIDYPDDSRGSPASRTVYRKVDVRTQFTGAALARGSRIFFQRRERR